MDVIGLANFAVRSFTGQISDLVRQQAASKGFDWPTSGQVYQYTSVATLLSMIRPDRGYVDTDPGDLNGMLRNLWATSAPYLNDSREFEHGKDMVRRAAKRVRRRLPSSEKPDVDLVLQAIERAEGLDVFCACFSRVGDHLGQWRGYGDNGRGCTLGFDLARLEREINGLGTWLVYGDKDDPMQKSVSDRLILDLIAALRSVRPATAADAAAYNHAAVDELSLVLPAVFLLFKDASFRDEFEYRVIYSDSVAQRPIQDANSEPRRWFRPGGPAVVPFVKLEFHNGNRAPLQTVRLGPAAGWKTNKQSLELLLQRCGLTNVTIDTSSIPFVPR